MISEDPNVKCPFWKYRTSCSITCEGPVAGTTVTWSWGGAKAARQQTEIFCYKHWEHCEIRRMIIENRDFEGQ